MIKEMISPLFCFNYRQKELWLMSCEEKGTLNQLFNEKRT